MSYSFLFILIYSDFELCTKTMPNITMAIDIYTGRVIGSPSNRAPNMIATIGLT